MFDNLREDAASSYEDEAKLRSAAGTAPAFGVRPRSKRILGMTSVQRFVIIFMLMLAVCVIGAMVLFVTGKIGF
jgi:hypothetical protein